MAEWTQQKQGIALKCITREPFCRSCLKGAIGESRGEGQRIKQNILQKFQAQEMKTCWNISKCFGLCLKKIHKGFEYSVFRECCQQTGAQSQLFCQVCCASLTLRAFNVPWAAVADSTGTMLNCVLCFLLSWWGLIDQLNIAQVLKSCRGCLFLMLHSICRKK